MNKTKKMVNIDQRVLENPLYSSLSKSKSKIGKTIPVNNNDDDDDDDDVL